MFSVTFFKFSHFYRIRNCFEIFKCKFYEVFSCRNFHRKNCPCLMKKLKNLFDGEQRNFITYAVVATSFFVLFVLFKPGSNIFNWIEARVEISRQEKQISGYRQELEDLDRRIDLLISDRDTLEKFAREQFHLAAPGEDVYIIEEK